MKLFNIKYRAKSVFLGLSIGLIPSCLFSQGDDNDNLNTDVTVFGIYDLEIKDASKFDSWPEYHESVIEMPTITYTLIPNKLRTNYQPALIKPAKINVEESLKKLYKGYVKGGYGMYNTPLLELRFMDGRSRKGSFNVFAKHYSSNGGTAFGDSIDDGFRNNEISLWGKRFVGKNALEGYFDWKNEQYNFFGFYPENFPDAAITGIDRTTNDFGAGLELRSYFRDTSKINYVGNFDFNSFSDNFDGTLNELNFKTSVRTEIESNLLEAMLRVEYDQYDYIRREDNEGDGFDNVLIEVKPTASTTKGNLTALVGLSFNFNSRKLDNQEEFVNFFPIANVQYSLFNNMFVPYAGIRGKVTQNSYRSFVEENPFVTTDPELRNTIDKIEVYGGLRGNLSPNAGFNAQISHKNVKNFIYWVNDTLTSPGSLLLPEYGELSITEVMGEVTINAGKKIDLFVKGQYFIYGADGLQRNIPWGQPSYQLSAIGRYNLEDKIIAEVEIYTMDKRTVKSYAPIPGAEQTDTGYYIHDLNGFFDFNLSLEYRYTKRLSGFAKVNNLFGSRYMRYTNYGTQRVAALMGVTYSF